ncbi:PhiH1 repressor [Salinirubellus salinus]|uniref:PhiH1 repressor n=1 Tax=Salinirubellus salinus TaxID=1364945 RepID=A0A9E7R4S5_9EURY|nr:PhiH1 repressor [Salinirubellus salinus]UWM55194.1 PhiH1 repressor [Salinirubellus salinus]
MRHSASWQNLWDDRILEIASLDDDGVVSVGDLSNHDLIRTSRSTVSRRCKKLAEHGLFRRVAEGVYVITDEGRGYLEGEYDVDQGIWLDQNQAEDGPTGPDAGTEEANGA